MVDTGSQLAAQNSVDHPIQFRENCLPGFRVFLSLFSPRRCNPAVCHYYSVVLKKQFHPSSVILYFLSLYLFDILPLSVVHGE